MKILVRQLPELLLSECFIIEEVWGGGLAARDCAQESDSAVPALAGGDSHPLPLRMNSNKEYPESR